ncbi:MAG: class I SAM-dependent methyltransferase [Mesorhizobium sp.]|nr:MAG: class I SAM-dependent methyltransferase [Mesorhizobium sp.]
MSEQNTGWQPDLQSSGRIREPFYPPERYGHIAAGLQQELASLPQAPEGHLSPEQAEFLYAWVRFLKPECVAETGFCVGHSACVVMHAQRSLGLVPRFLSIDICQFPETRAAAEKLRSLYETFVFVEGDSKLVLADAVNRYLRSNEGVQLQFALVDGSHDREVVESDLEVFAAFLSPGGMIWLDDFGKFVPNFGVNVAGRNFAAKWGACHSFRSSGNRGILLYQKAF